MEWNGSYYVEGTSFLPDQAPLPSTPNDTDRSDYREYEDDPDYGDRSDYDPEYPLDEDDFLD
jgi:hypothetical protein